MPADGRTDTFVHKLHQMEIIEKRGLSSAQEKFRKNMLNGWLFRSYALMQVPMGWIAGMKLLVLNPEKAVSTLPFKWLSKNPFKSMYFAVQSMAAELSTAGLALLAIEGQKPSIATIIIDMDGEFPKRATERVYFTCVDGEKVFAAIEACKASGEAVSARLKTEGKMKDGTLVSVFHFTWSFKPRSR